MPTRFSFDLGTTSIGSAVYALNDSTQSSGGGKPTSLLHLGVKIFSDGRDPQTGESFAAKRRTPRAMRRQQDRKISRRLRVERLLAEAGMLPPKGADRDRLFFCHHPKASCAVARDDLCNNPIRLRARAAREAVTIGQLGRALWHISKHRAFASNRKTDPTDEEAGLIRSASKRLEKELSEGGNEGTLTYGEYLWDRMKAGEGIRIRPVGENAAKHYEFFPTRKMIEAEFDAIWEEQKRHHALSEDLRQELRDTIFHQRPLKPVDPGRCTFFPDQPRLARWHPAAQAFLILQQIGNMRLIRDGVEERVGLELQSELFDTLYGGKKMSWKAVRKTAGLSGEDKINLEEGGLKNLHFNQVASALLGSAAKPGPLAAVWPKWDAPTREVVLERLAEAQDPEALLAWLTTEVGLDAKSAKEVEKVHLPSGHLRFCHEVVKALVKEMRERGLGYSDAVEQAPLLDAAGVRHSDNRAEFGVDMLPPYNELPALQRMLGNGSGNPDDPRDVRLGRIGNPTVHVALGQFRRVMNALIQEYGKPAEVVLETTRDLALSKKQKDALEKQSKANEKRNDRYRAELEAAGYLMPGQRVGDMFLKMRLWEELGKKRADRRCPYSGRLIELSDLHSGAVEIEHILPFGETFDNTPANKTLAYRVENQRKGNLSPGEAAARGIFDQEEIVQRTKHLPRNKAWRFLPNAMEIFEEQKSFEDRQLHATGYLARVVRAYAEALFDKVDVDGVSRHHVWMLPGRMTGLLRDRWGLNTGPDNRKDRHDHRHHAIDAAVVGVIDRPMIAKLQSFSKSPACERGRVLPSPPEPYAGFRQEVLDAVGKVRVCHRARHPQGAMQLSAPRKNGVSYTSGRLHKEGRYGKIRDLPGNHEALSRAGSGLQAYVMRTSIQSLSMAQISRVRDPSLRTELEAVSKQEGKWETNLAEWSRESGVKRVRLIETLSGLRPLVDREGREFTHLRRDEISYMDILEGSDGKWFAFDVDVWGLHLEGTQDWRSHHPDARFIMRLHKGDTIQIFDWDRKRKEVIPGTNDIKLVRKFSNSPGTKRLDLCGIDDAGELAKRHKDEDDPFRWDLCSFDMLRLRRARRVRIDELGRVHTVPHGVIRHSKKCA